MKQRRIRLLLLVMTGLLMISALLCSCRQEQDTAYFGSDMPAPQKIVLSIKQREEICTLTRRETEWFVTYFQNLPVSETEMDASYTWEDPVFVQCYYEDYRVDYNLAESEQLMVYVYDEPTADTPSRQFACQVAEDDSSYLTWMETKTAYFIKLEAFQTWERLYD